MSNKSSAANAKGQKLGANQDGQKVEKSREEVLAEREARKQQKNAQKDASKAKAASKEQAAPKKEKGKTELTEKKEKKENKEQKEHAVTEKKLSERRGSVGPEGDDGRRNSESKISHPSHNVMLQFDDPKRVAKFTKKGTVKLRKLEKQVPLFSHVPQYERRDSLSLQVGFSANELFHPAFVRLGLKLAEGTISGSNARCVALLNASKEYIQDYQTPPDKVLRMDMQNGFKPLIRFLVDCRPLCISMKSAIVFIKHKVSQITEAQTEAQAKEFLIDKINSYIQERIEFADQAIAGLGVSRIADGDVVLTFSKSHVVEMLLKKAHDERITFRVIVADSRPKLEGKELTRALVKYGVKCTYILVTALSYVMHEVNKVFLGASGVLANGAVLSRVGSALVGIMAHRHNIPLLVCCETYKFTDRVQLDSICFNELGDPDDLIHTDRDDTRYGDVLMDWRDNKNIMLLNLNYDLTPAEFVSVLVTEVGMIPPTSVPAILREYHKDEEC